MIKTYRFRKNKSLPRKNKTRKGGAVYRIGTVKNGVAYISKNIDNQSITLKERPFLSIANIPNVFSFPNKDDTNYKYYGYYISQIDDPVDFDNIVWSIQNYFNKEIAPKVPGNTFRLDLSSDIRIYDFKCEHILTPIGGQQMKSSYLLQGNIYVTNLEKLNKDMNEQIFTKVPGEIENNIKSYIGGSEL